MIFFAHVAGKYDIPRLRIEIIARYQTFLQFTRKPCTLLIRFSHKGKEACEDVTFHVMLGKYLPSNWQLVMEQLVLRQSGHVGGRYISIFSFGIDSEWLRRARSQPAFLLCYDGSDKSHDSMGVLTSTPPWKAKNEND